MAEPSIELAQMEAIGLSNCQTDPEQGMPNAGSKGIEKTVIIRTKIKGILAYLWKLYKLATAVWMIGHIFNISILL